MGGKRGPSRAGGGRRRWRGWGPPLQPGPSSPPIPCPPLLGLHIPGRPPVAPTHFPGSTWPGLCPPRGPWVLGTAPRTQGRRGPWDSPLGRSLPGGCRVPPIRPSLPGVTCPAYSGLLREERPRVRSSWRNCCSWGLRVGSRDGRDSRAWACGEPPLPPLYRWKPQVGLVLGPGTTVRSLPEPSLGQSDRGPHSPP